MARSNIERLALEALARGEEKVHAGRLRPEFLEWYIRGSMTGHPWPEVKAVLNSALAARNAEPLRLRDD